MRDLVIYAYFDHQFDCPFLMLQELSLRYFSFYDQDGGKLILILKNFEKIVAFWSVLQHSLSRKYAFVS